MTYATNPFPGLRPFESNESALFFGRDEQCDELLARLARRRLVAVVGASGSGKSSLVRAGLLPALQRGYLPVAGSAWQIVVFRPGGNPIASLTDALLSPAARASATAPLTRESLSDMLESSSLGLVAAARRLLEDGASSMLVLVDQFEEIFRFRDLAGRAEAEERAADCVQLLLGAAGQEDVPVYVVLTMRSDYLGDCAQFAGLPEALNDSQFLVPRMTREQLRAAIEGPVAVGGGKITPRLVQRLLHDVDALSGRTIRPPGGLAPTEYDHDQLPVLQHALMRVWDVSKTTRDAGGAIDLEHYELPPVETIHHALDRHADEVYNALPSETHRDVARKIFQRLTERDWENRDVRRPTKKSELVAVATLPEASVPPETVASAVHTVIQEFAAPGRAFVVMNAQQDVDISHESFIRKWNRLRDWVQEEGRSRQTYVRLAEAAAEWVDDRASLYRGPELAEADRWWKKEAPSPAWAGRYHPGFATAERFLRRSLVQQRLRRTAFAAAIVLTIGTAIVMTALWLRATAAEEKALAAAELAQKAEQRALVAEAEAKGARDAVASVNAQLKAGLEREAALAARAGNRELAARLNAEVAKADVASSGGKTLTSGEVKELERLRKEAATAVADLQIVRKQLDDLSGESTKLRETITGLNAQVARSRDELKNVTDDREALKTRLDNVTAQLKTANDARAALQAKLTDALAAADNVATGPAPIKGDYRFLYERGLSAKSRQQWQDAERFFEAAARLRADTGELIPLEPRGSVPYLPNYQLGIVRRQLACDAWDAAEKLAQKDNKIRDLKDYAAMLEQRKGCESR